MAATRTGAARILQRHGNKPATVPRQLAIRLATKLEPALVEDGVVQAGPGPDVLARILGGACRRSGQIPYRQVLNIAEPIKSD